MMSSKTFENENYYSFRLKLICKDAPKLRKQFNLLIISWINPVALEKLFDDWVVISFPSALYEPIIGMTSKYANNKGKLYS